MQYRREIDGLRALAVVPVILFHAGVAAFSGGFVGVDVFFVISGYLITSIILAEKAAGTFTLAGFYERRARRILPALFVVMAACLPAAWLWLYPEDLRRFSGSLVAVVLFISNHFFNNQSGYFDTAGELKPLLHTWSLAVEEQYYVLFPVLLALAWRFGRRGLALLLCLIAVCSLAWSQWASVARPTAAFFLLPSRGWELLTGALVAFHLSAPRIWQPARPTAEAGSATGLLLLAYAIFAFDSMTPWPGFYALVPVLGTALIILFASPQTGAGKLLGSKLFVGIGLVSYSAYLWHQPLLAFARHASIGEPHKAVMLALAAASLVLAFFSWKYVETPLRDRARFSRKKIFIYGALGSAFFLAIGVAGNISNGFEKIRPMSSVHEGDVGHLASHHELDLRYFRCKPEAIAREALTWEGHLRCMQSLQGDKADIALLGDSHAEHLFPGLAEQLPGKNLVFYIHNASPFVDSAQFSKIYAHLRQSASIRTVILSVHWSGRTSEMPKGSSVEAELLKIIQLLKDAGKTVYLLDDIPWFPYPAEKCKYELPGSTRSICVMPKAAVLAQEERIAPALKSAAQATGVPLMPLRDYFCDGSTCSMLRDNVMMYSDSNHLNLAGSRYVAGEIMRHWPALGQ